MKFFQRRCGAKGSGKQFAGGISGKGHIFLGKFREKICQRIRQRIHAAKKLVLLILVGVKLRNRGFIHRKSEAVHCDHIANIRIGIARAKLHKGIDAFAADGLLIFEETSHNVKIARTFRQPGFFECLFDRIFHAQKVGGGHGFHVNRSIVEAGDKKGGLLPDRIHGSLRQMAGKGSAIVERYGNFVAMDIAYNAF